MPMLSAFLLRKAESRGSSCDNKYGRAVFETLHKFYSYWTHAHTHRHIFSENRITLVANENRKV